MVRSPPPSVLETPWCTTVRGATLKPENSLVSNRDRASTSDCSSGLCMPCHYCLRFSHLSPCLSTVVLWAMPPASLLFCRCRGASEEYARVLEMVRSAWRGWACWCLFVLGGRERAVRKAEADCLVRSGSNSPSQADPI